MGNHKMAKSTALKAYQIVQHKFGPMDEKLFLRMFPEFVPFM
jgi:muramidase (phage lysozyme)